MTKHEVISASNITSYSIVWNVEISYLRLNTQAGETVLAIRDLQKASRHRRYSRCGRKMREIVTLQACQLDHMLALDNKEEPNFADAAQRLAKSVENDHEGRL